MSAAVLLSGGYDSALALIRAQEKHERVRCFFFEYGQPYLAPEQEAIAYHRSRGVDVETVVIPPLEAVVPPWNPALPPEFPMRNVIFLNHVLAQGAWSAVYVGLRGIMPTYRDTGLLWLLAARRYTGANVLAPTLALPKFMVRRGLRQAGVDIGRLFTSEGYVAA